MVALLADKAFQLDTAPAKAAIEIATILSGWMDSNVNRQVCEGFEVKLLAMLDACITSKRASAKMNRKQMWTAYHTLRVSSEYLDLWRSTLHSAGIENPHPAFFQHVGNEIFKCLIRSRHPLQQATGSDKSGPLTYEEQNALRYFAGYIPRMLRKRLREECPLEDGKMHHVSSHPLKRDILLCIYDLLDDAW